jgi:hypothetical protein
LLKGVSFLHNLQTVHVLGSRYRASEFKQTALGIVSIYYNDMVKFRSRSDEGYKILDFIQIIIQGAPTKPAPSGKRKTELKRARGF